MKKNQLKGRSQTKTLASNDDNDCGSDQSVMRTHQLGKRPTKCDLTHWSVLEMAKDTDVAAGKEAKVAAGKQDENEKLVE